MKAMMRINSIGLLAVLLLCGMQLRAQDNVIDEVIWVVGDEAILRSEVEEERLRAQYEGQEIAGDPYCVIPEQLAIQKLFLHQAELDSVEVSESTVATQVNMRLNYYISQIGSKEKLEEYFRKPMSEMKEDMTTAVRNQMIIQQMQQELTKNIKSTPAEVRRYYSRLRQDSIPTIPAQVEVQIITLDPPVPQSEVDRVKERLRDFTERVNNGSADFSMLARLYSEDTESAKRGGELGFVGKGQLVPEFADVAFNLNDPRRVSRIVETEYGYHIIQLIEKRGDRINCRHILLKPRLSQSDKTESINKLDSIANLIRTGKVTFEQAVAFFSQDKNTAMNAGVMMNQETGATKFEYQSLPPEIARQIHGMNVGEISNPFLMIDETKNKEVCVIVKLKSKTDVHKANLVDDYQVIRTMYEQQESEAFLHKWILQKQKDTYIMIDPEWRGCDFEYPGWVKED